MVARLPRCRLCGRCFQRSQKEPGGHIILSALSILSSAAPLVSCAPRSYHIFGAFILAADSWDELEPLSEKLFKLKELKEEESTRERQERIAKLDGKNK